MWKNGKTETGKTLISSIYEDRLYNDCFLRSSYSASIHFKPMLQNYGKTAFFTSGTLAWNESNTFQRTLTTTKHGCFFFKNWQEQLMWQKIIISSCKGRKRHSRIFGKKFLIWRYSQKGLQISPKSGILITALTIFLVFGLK